MAHPTRLVGISYTGSCAYFVTTCTRDRVKAFANLDFGQRAANALFDHAGELHFEVSAYCLMPDHAHLLLAGLRDTSQLRRIVERWKQATGFRWSCAGHGRLWQHGYWERVLRGDEAILSVARYVIENPVRAALVERAADYPLLGSSVFTVDQICEAVQMRRGWPH